MSRNCIIDHLLKIDLRCRRRISFEVLIHLGHPHLADAIGNRVVNDRPQRAATPFEPTDEDEPPKRARPVERLRVELGSEVEKLPVRSRSGQHDFANVRVDVELCVGDPRRGRNSTKAGHGALIEARGARDTGTHLTHEPSGVDRLIEQNDRTTTGVEPRVLLDTPHQRLVLAHPVGVVDFSFSCGHRDVSSQCLGVIRSGSGANQVRLRCRCRDGVRTRRSGRPCIRAGTSASTHRSWACDAREPRAATDRPAPA